MSKKIRKIVGTLAPIAVSFIPGIGPLLGAAIGAGSGFLTGGGLKGALAGGLTGGLASGGASLLGKGLGFTGAAAPAVGGALGGAAAGGLSGGLKGALSGGLTGGLGGYYSGGGFDGTAIGDLVGTSAGTPLAGGIGPTQGTGALGALTRAGSSIGGLAGTGTGSGSSYGGLSSALGGLLNYGANTEAEDDLIASQRKALGRIEPYQNMEFTPGDLTQDPGYQFRLQQGEEALGRSQSARGNYFSGAALKEAQNFGQGLADQTYNDAYQRWLQQNQQNIGAAGIAGGFDQGIGQTQAQAGIGRGNILSQALAGVLGQRRLYDPFSQQYVNG